MRILTATSLVLVLLFHTFAKVWVVVSWMANRDYIAKNLCEKRNTPMAKHCNGKCHLRKSMEQQDKGSSTPFSTENSTDYVETYYLPAPTIDFKLEPIGSIETYSSAFYYRLPCTDEWRGSAFHPPA